VVHIVLVSTLPLGPTPRLTCSRFLSSQNHRARRVWNYFELTHGHIINEVAEMGDC